MSLILVVDDIDEVRDKIVFFLESDGHKAITAIDVPSAVKKLNEILKTRSKVPDLILCDVNLPNTPGVELFNITRSNSFFKDIPFIFKTFADRLPDCEYTDAITGFVTHNKL